MFRTREAAPTTQLSTKLPRPIPPALTLLWFSTETVPRPVPTAPLRQPALTALLALVFRAAPTLLAVLPPLALLVLLVQETPPLLALPALPPVLLLVFPLPPPVLLSLHLQLFSLLTECFSSSK